MEDSKKDGNAGQSVEGPIILIDNNMIQHFLSKEYGQQLEPILKEIDEIHGTLAVSQIVVYEALKAICFSPTRRQ